MTSWTDVEAHFTLMMNYCVAKDLSIAWQAFNHVIGVKA